MLCAIAEAFRLASMACYFVRDGLLVIFYARTRYRALHGLTGHVLDDSEVAFYCRLLAGALISLDKLQFSLRRSC